MKKVLSIVLSIAMLMTVAMSAFVMPVSAGTENIKELMVPEYIVEGTENVTVNEDGTWTITGNFALRCDINYDIEVVQNIYQDLDTNTPVKITIYDEPNGQRWIGLYDNWVGPSHFPAEPYKGNNGLLGVYTWNGWDYSNGANVTAIYFEFDGATENTVMTLTSLYLNDGTLKPAEVNLGEQEYSYDSTIELAVKDVDAWSLTDAEKNGGATPVLNVTDDALVVGTDKPGWPSVYMDYVGEPIVVDANAMIYADFTVGDTAATTIYLFFNGSTADDFQEGQYVALHAGDLTSGHYAGYISLNKVVSDACYNEDGDIVITGVKIFGTDNVTEGGNAAAVTVNALDVLYTAPADDPTPPVDGVLGDMTGDGVLNMMDALVLYSGVSGATVLTEAQTALADYNPDGTVNMMDVLVLYTTVSGS